MSVKRRASKSKEEKKNKEAKLHENSERVGVRGKRHCIEVRNEFAAIKQIVI